MNTATKALPCMPCTALRLPALWRTAAARVLSETLIQYSIIGIGVPVSFELFHNNGSFQCPVSTCWPDMLQQVVFTDCSLSCR